MYSSKSSEVNYLIKIYFVKVVYKYFQKITYYITWKKSEKE